MAGSQGHTNNGEQNTEAEEPEANFIPITAGHKNLAARWGHRSEFGLSETVVMKRVLSLFLK